MSLRTVGGASLTALGLFCLKDIPFVKEKYDKAKELVKRNKALATVGALGVGAAAVSYLWPWFQKANELVQMGYEISELTAQLDAANAGPGDTEAVAAHAEEWKNYALTTWAQINKSARMRV